MRELTYGQPRARGQRTSRVAVWWVCVGLAAILSLPISVFGLHQLAQTTLNQLNGAAEVTDFLAYYSGAQLLVHDAPRLYDPSAQREVQQALQTDDAAYVPFVSPPYAALLQTPLALLPFGVAYAVWELLSLACIAASAWLLAPRGSGRRLWLLSLALLPLFLPVQFGLIMGQSSALMLLGFCVFARLSLDGGQARGGLALLTWALKPNLLPSFVVVLACARRWRTLLVGAAILAALGLGSIALIGPDGLRGLLVASTLRMEVAAARPDGYPEGLTFLVIAQAFVGVGPVATALTLLASALTWLSVGWVWRRGLASDARRYLQLAMLPIAATLASVHAGVYELTTWLASTWLLLEYARRYPAHRAWVWTLILAIVALGNLGVIVQTTPLLSAVCGLAALVLCGLLALFILGNRLAADRGAPGYG